MNGRKPRTVTLSQTPAVILRFFFTELSILYIITDGKRVLGSVGKEVINPRGNSVAGTSFILFLRRTSQRIHFKGTFFLQSADRFHYESLFRTVRLTAPGRVSVQAQLLQHKPAVQTLFPKGDGDADRFLSPQGKKRFRTH